MRKRERENPCLTCGHYHKCEEGEVCGICGHRPAAFPSGTLQSSAFPSEILKDFLYLGSYDNASRNEVLKTMRISHILNTVPSLQNLYKNSFTYHCLRDGNDLEFDDAVQFLERCEREKVRVLVHCMSGKNRSPAIVIAYLMKSKGWRLEQSVHWVKDRRPSVELAPAVYQQLLEYESKVFGLIELNQTPTFISADSLPQLGFGFPNPANVAPVPTFNQSSTSIFDRSSPRVSTNEFVFVAALNNEQIADNNNIGIPLQGTAAPMDSF